MNFVKNDGTFFFVFSPRNCFATIHIVLKKRGALTCLEQIRDALKIKMTPAGFEPTTF